jgi:hypothetical protein
MFFESAFFIFVNNAERRATTIMNLTTYISYDDGPHLPPHLSFLSIPRFKGWQKEKKRMYGIALLFL